VVGTTGISRWAAREADIGEHVGLQPRARIWEGDAHLHARVSAVEDVADKRNLP